MPRKSHSLRHHKASNQGFVELGGRRIYLGKWGLPETEEAYHRAIAEWMARGRHDLCIPEETTVAQLSAAYWKHCTTYYRVRDGKPSGELHPIRSVLRYLVSLYGETEVGEFGPLALKAVRQAMVDAGLARSTINGQVGRIKRMFRWAAEEELVSGEVYHAVQAVSAFQKGRGSARETDPVGPVSRADIEAVRPLVSRQVRALIDLQLLTAARPGELVILRQQDVQTSGRVWFAAPTQHKNAHRGQSRMLYLGPRAQEVIRPFLLRGPNAFLFSPREAERERLAIRHDERKTPPNVGNRPGTNRVKRPGRKPGSRYTPASYRRAIQRACEEAEIDVWSPNQLRHTVATEVRKEYGLEAAQVICGHARADTTQIYAEADIARAIEIQRQRG